MLVDVALTDDQGRHWKGHAQLAEDTSTTSTTTPTPPPASPTTVPPTDWTQATVVIPGVHDPAKPADLGKAYPGVRMVREFVDGGVLSNPEDVDGFVQRVLAKCTPAWAAGLVPSVSFKLNIAQVMAGRWAPALKALGLALAGKQVLVIVWHEPEDDMPGVTFVPYFALVRAQLHAGDAHVPVGYAAMAYQWAPKASSPGKSIAGHTDDAAVWAAVQADFYAVDVYSGRSFDLGLTLPEHPGFKRWYDNVIAGRARAWMVAERGFEAGSDKSQARADAIAREAAWLDGPGARASGLFGYIYWNTQGTEASTTLGLDTAGRAQLAALVSRLAARRTT